MARLNVMGKEPTENSRAWRTEKRKTGNLRSMCRPGSQRDVAVLLLRTNLGTRFQSTAEMPRSGKEVETICDKIAAEILMPTRIFKGLAGDRPDIDTLQLQLTSTCLCRPFFRAAELYRFWSFGVNDGAVNWTAGLTKQRFASVAPASLLALNGQCAVKVARSRSKYTMVRASRVAVEWRCLGNSKRAVFLMTP